MAKRVVTGTFLSLDLGAGAVDLTASIDNAELPLESDTVESTDMSSAGWREFLAGLKQFSLTINLHKDADLSVVDDDFFTLFGSGATVAFVLRGTSSAVSASNAEYTGNILINNWTPIAGSVGDLFAASYTFQGTGAVSRGTGA